MNQMREIKLKSGHFQFEKLEVSGSVAIVLMKKIELIVLLLLSFWHLVTVNAFFTFPHGAVGWSAWHECGIS